MDSDATLNQQAKNVVKAHLEGDHDVLKDPYFPEYLRYFLFSYLLKPKKIDLCDVNLTGFYGINNFLFKFKDGSLNEFLEFLKKLNLYIYTDKLDFKSVHSTDYVKLLISLDVKLLISLDDHYCRTQVRDYLTKKAPWKACYTEETKKVLDKFQEELIPQLIKHKRLMPSDPKKYQFQSSE